MSRRSFIILYLSTGNFFRMDATRISPTLPLDGRRRRRSIITGMQIINAYISIVYRNCVITIVWFWQKYKIIGDYCRFNFWIMIYGYIRVSSDKQTVGNQRFEINNFCKKNDVSIDGWIEETISGTKAYIKRQLGVLLRRVKKDDLIINAKLSRLGRNLFMIMEILNICMTK